MRELYQLPGIAETVKARYYVINYWSIARLNPMGIIPKGTPVDYSGPHDRARRFPGLMAGETPGKH